MFTISLVTMSLAACSFLSYVFMQFCRELMHAGKNADGTRKAGGISMRHGANSMTFRSARHARTGRQGSEKAVMRKEVLTSLVVGVIGLLVPYIVALLLHSGSQLAH